MPKPQLINRLAEVRNSRNMTQEQLARALGVDWRMVSYWETGYRTPRIETILEIARILNCKVEDLFTLLNHI
jgi:DNA-binding XRE family transcriptional regulator